MPARALEARHHGEKIQYPGERVEGAVATVSTRIVTKKGTEVPIDYRLLKRGERWRVSDVSIEGVSLIANYRTQFHSVTRTPSKPRRGDAAVSRGAQALARG